MKSLAVTAEGHRGPPNFIQRVYRTTAVVSLIVALAVLGYFGWMSAGSYLLGAFLGIGLLWVLERAVDASIRRLQRSRHQNAAAEPPVPPKGGRGAVIVGLNVLKYILVALGLYLLIAHGGVRPWFLLAGYGTIYIVIVLKVVGRLMVRSSQECAGAATTDTSGGSSGGL